MARSVLVTGASSGIGRATVERLLASGWHVLATARRDEDLEALEALGCTAIRLELTDRASIEAAVANVQAANGADAVVLNAGVAVFGTVEDVTAEGWHHQFEVNLLGPIALLRPLLADLRARKGRVVIIGSQSGLISIPMMGPYCASKAAIEAVADALRMELASSGARVSVVEPGPAHTRFRERTRELMGRHATPSQAYGGAYGALERRMSVRMADVTVERIARTVQRALESRWPRPRYVVGRLTSIGLRLALAAPTRVRDRVLRALFGI